MSFMAVGFMNIVLYESIREIYRLVIDYGSLNAVTFDDKYPTSWIDEILDNLGRNTYIDFAQGFY